MTRQMIPLPVKTETVDLNTGASTSATMTAMMMPAKEGTCETCATPHDAAEPHNAQSLFYQMRFHAENGRYPDWRDAMAHCDDEMKSAWTIELLAIGVDVEGGKVNPERKR
jgi:hypothetical protein